MFDPSVYGPEIAEICRAEGAAARELLGRSQLPDTVRAGLFLRAGGWKEAHELVQDLESADAYYWHAIVHRMEPDAANSGYWFRQVGMHPIFGALRERAAQAGYRAGAEWDPFAFIRYEESVRAGSEEERIARAVAQAEWELLFDHCARGMV